MERLIRRAAAVVSPRAVFDQIVRETIADCLAAFEVFPQGTPHQWLTMAWVARAIRQKSAWPVGHLRAAGYDGTWLLAATLDWPESAQALGQLFYWREHPGRTNSDPYMASEFSSFMKLESQARDPRGRELLEAAYQMRNQPIAPPGNPAERPSTPARAAAASNPNVIRSFEPSRPASVASVHAVFARHVLDWSEGVHTDDELFEFIDQYRKDTDQSAP
ncbi:hypothetical protein OU995_21370 [Roseateles sp. SL47]|uniref:hypothetical protein n=1 Tax=Roseateles sp. SL47 TaxID=2995138 RepID=UPI00227013FC|nr:hypothetical protein [Roseateles sp. SL47]WAC72094.1 hypothetical protein OU995_21370 [Roseateles sp. SL47]